MVLRSLELRDAPLMLEWMHDERVSGVFRFPAMEYTLNKVEEFIKNSKIVNELDKPSDIHYAITEDGGEYLGTISLKNIDYVNRNAEYAIVLRYSAQRKGIALEATKELLEMFFERLELHRLYLNVLSDNFSAVELYKKIGFIYEGQWKEHLFLNGKWRTLSWYAMTRDVWESNKI